MTQKLRDYPAELLALAQLVADHFSISPAYVEKDFWVTEVLRATMSKSLVPPDTLHGRLFNPIFKGGTSLSRALRLTRRFSEDIDICLVFPPGVGKRQRHGGLFTWIPAFDGIWRLTLRMCCLRVPARG